MVVDYHTLSFCIENLLHKDDRTMSSLTMDRIGQQRQLFKKTIMEILVDAVRFTNRQTPFYD